MRIFYAFIIGMLWSAGGAAQTLDVFTRRDQAVYVPLSQPFQQVYQVPMYFGKSELLDDWKRELITVHRIDSVVLAYTDYPKGMNLEQLNLSRLRKFNGLFPGALSQPQISWHLVRQTDCRDQVQAEGLFHGFYIYYKPLPSGIPPSRNIAPLTRSQQALVQKRLAALVERKLHLSLDTDTTTATVFKRHAEHWRNMVIVSDWTGSMYRYTLQVLLWQLQELKSDNILAYVLFNDGDAKTTAEKEQAIGRTGGIYMVPTSQVNPVVALMARVKKMGDGGDIPENDMEALLFAQAKFPQCEQLVLIADNKSDMRDFTLLETLKMPVRVVLSRLEPDAMGRVSIHPQYVRLALSTKGSIHTASQDYETPQALKDLLPSE